MDHHNGSPNMQTAHSYPSPSAVAVVDGAGPFFTHQQRLSSPDDLRLSAQLSRSHPPMMSSHAGPDPGLPLQHPRHAGHLRQSNGPVDQFQHQAGTDPTHDPAFADPNAPRKRSKVSRACDECRRKKIRCDATSESGLEQCSSCKRVGTRCQFSRVPMKRGPSKGYIKELADRLNTLENSMTYGTVDQSGHSPRAMEGFSPPPMDGPETSGYARKRTYSLSNEAANAAYHQPLPQRPSLGGWSALETPRHLPHPASTLHTPQTPQPNPSGSEVNHVRSHRSQFSPNGVTQSFWKQSSADLGRRDSVSVPGDSTDGRLSDQNHTEAMLEWNDSTVDRYYEMIHLTFPLLSNSKSRLRSRLANCSVTLREAFLEALDAAVRSCSGSSVQSSPDMHGTRKAADLLAAAQFENHATRTVSTNLVYLQTMILMALEADNRGPSTLKGQFGPPGAVWLGAAVGLAYYLRLHSLRPRDRHSGGDDDSDEKLGRRDWWVLVMLDRWHASSTSSPVLIPDSSLAFLPEDHALLGDSSFHLARLSCIIGHIAEIFVAAEDIMGSSAAVGPLVSKLLRGEIERFREGLDLVMGSLETVQLAYWHATLLVKRITPTSEPYDVLSAAQHMAKILNSPNTPITPLHHHFAALAVVTLIGLVDISETREGASSSLQTMFDALERWRGPLAPHEDITGWDAAIRDAILKKQQQQEQSIGGVTTENNNSNNGNNNHQQGGLQHLADLAVGERGQNAPSNSSGTSSTGQQAQSQSAELLPTTSTTQGTMMGTTFNVLDATMLMRNGYLTILAQDEIRP